MGSGSSTRYAPDVKTASVDELRAVFKTLPEAQRNMVASSLLEDELARKASYELADLDLNHLKKLADDFAPEDPGRTKILIGLRAYNASIHDMNNIYEEEKSKWPNEAKELEDIRFQKKEGDMRKTFM